MTNAPLLQSLPRASWRDEMFPKLADGLVGRLIEHGRVRQTSRGEVLVEPGESTKIFLVVYR